MRENGHLQLAPGILASKNWAAVSGGDDLGMTHQPLPPSTSLGVHIYLSCGWRCSSIHHASDWQKHCGDPWLVNLNYLQIQREQKECPSLTHSPSLTHKEALSARIFYLNFKKIRLPYEYSRFLWSISLPCPQRCY